MQPTAAGYVDAELLFPLVARMESSGIPSRWPHPVQLWKLLTSKEWMSNMCICPQFQIPLTTCISKGLVLRDPSKAAQLALEALRVLKKDRDRCEGPVSVTDVVAKLGYSYEGVDVKMVPSEKLGEALYFLLTQPNYTNTSVYVQERIKLSCEVRCFLINGRIEQMLYTRFGRIDVQGYVREYEKDQVLKKMHKYIISQRCPILSIIIPIQEDSSFFEGILDFPLDTWMFSKCRL